MRFPLDLRFRIISIATRLSVTDASGQMQYHVRQKMFRLKEAISVYADEQQATQLFTIAADRVLDFSAQYHITGTDGARLGHVQRKGMRSIWRAHYEIHRDGQPEFLIREENPWVKVADSFVGSIPVLGLASAYLLHPAYVVTRVSDGSLAARASKQPALFENSYRIDANPDRLGRQAELVVLSLMMMLLLERYRG